LKVGFIDRSIEVLSRGTTKRQMCYITFFPNLRYCIFRFVGLGGAKRKRTKEKKKRKDTSPPHPLSRKENK